MGRLIKASEFVMRQTKESRFSYFDGTLDELVKFVEENFGNRKDGYRDGVVLVPVPTENFYTSICEVDADSIFETVFDSRREGEECATRRVLINGEKTKAKFVDIVLYRHDILEENNERSMDSEWEIISINASIVENTPMHPMTMARNMLDEIGGTKAEYSGQQFAEAIWFWKNHCLYEGGE